MNPVVLGAGPSGCTAAIVLARSGPRPLLIDRYAEAGDALCGGFLSWRTAAQLRQVDCDPVGLGGWPVRRLRLFADGRAVEAMLPATGFGLSRRVLDTAMRAAAVKAGADFQVDHARGVAAGVVQGRNRDWPADAVFLAAGKHDVRGLARPRKAADPALGLRVRVEGDRRLAALVDDAIELHLFPGGYAGIVRQEGGSVNICLAVRKSLLTKAGGQPLELLAQLAERCPQLGARLAGLSSGDRVDTIASVPYGYVTQRTDAGLFRLGDQAAVIPSLAGEGMAIAVASGLAAAGAYLAQGPGAAPAYQRAFARRATRPVRTAELIWHIAERGWGARTLIAAASCAPWLSQAAMQLSRIGQPSFVTQPWRSSTVPS